MIVQVTVQNVLKCQSVVLVQARAEKSQGIREEAVLES